MRFHGAYPHLLSTRTQRQCQTTITLVQGTHNLCMSVDILFVSSPVSTSYRGKRELRPHMVTKSIQFRESCHLAKRTIDTEGFLIPNI
jgi:hypothetical protein